MDTSHRSESRPTLSERLGRSRESVGIIAAVVTLFVGVGTILLFTLLRELPAAAPALALVLLALPLIVYLVVSNRLAEVSGPGGLRIILLKATRKPAAGFVLTELSYIRIRRVDFGRDVTELKAQANDQSDQIVELRAKPNALLLEPPYDDKERPICEFLKRAKWRGSNLKYLVVREKSGQYVAFMPLASVLAHPDLQDIDGKCTADQLLIWLSNGNEGALKDVKGYVGRTGAARRTDTRASVLRTMYEGRLDALPVLDETGAVVGLAEMGRLMQSVIVDLAQGVDTSTS